MENTYTNTVTRSYGNKIGSAFRGVIFGIFLIIASVALTFINESRQADRMGMLGDASRKVVEIDPSANATNDGKLVHMTGFVRTSDILTDPAFGFSPDNILKLRRDVEMYQWHEDIKEDRHNSRQGGEKIVQTVRYYKDWSPALIDSGSFERSGKQNPGIFPIDSYTKSGKHMDVEHQIVLSAGMVNAIGGFQDYRPEQRLPGYQPIAGSSYYYNGENYAEPAVGDVRIRYQSVPEGVFSLIGMYNRQALHPHTHKDQSLALATPGVVGPDEMIQAERKSTSIKGWIFRALGLIMMWIGLGALFAPFQAVASILPFFGRIVGGITGFITFFAALAGWGIVVSVAWILARPVVGTVFAVVTLGVIIATRKLAKRKREKASAVPPTNNL